jgi:hypothetical protein
MKSPPKLAPALKDWIDNVIVPALVREYVAEAQEQNKLAFTDDRRVLSASEPMTSVLTTELQ